MNQKIHKNDKMRVIKNKEHTKIEKKSRDAKIGQNEQKLWKIEKKIILCEFRPQKNK